MDDTRWLAPDELEAWLGYVAVTALLESHLDRQLQRDSGMPHAYYQILAMLSEVPNRTLRMSDLAAITQSSQSRLSHAVTRQGGAGPGGKAHPRRRTVGDGHFLQIAAESGQHPAFS